MHPIEQLRFVARSRGVDSGLLVEEAADALGFFANEQRALITACRQLLSRQPGVGPLWWLCNRLVLASNPRVEARLVLEDCWQFSAMQHRETAELNTEIGVVIHTDAAGTDEPVMAGGPDVSRQSLVSSDTIRQIDEAETAGLTVWLVMGPGVWLPTLVWKEVKARCHADPRNDLVVLDLDRVDGVLRPDGKVTPDQLAPSAMPVAPELLVRLN